MLNALIVDSCAASRHFLSELLHHFGYHATAVGDGLEAVQLSRSQKPDVVICDVLLQTIDGYEFLSRLRGNSVNAGTPVVFYVTPCCELDARAAADEFAVSQVLAKSADPAAVLDAVHAATPRTGTRPSPARLASFALRKLGISPVEVDPNATVFIVDDDPRIQALLTTIISAAGLKCAAYGAAEEFLDSYRDEPGCLLLDLDMPTMSGIDAFEQLRSQGKHIPTIILTGLQHMEAAQLAIRLRAVDLLQKPVVARSLFARIHCGLRQDANYRLKRSEAAVNRSRVACLTRRERELLKLIAAGLPSKTIAANLGIAVKTVSNHRSHLLAKTGASNMADLVRMNVNIDAPLEFIDG
jgi:FixJ family two-component response regulator